MDNGYGILSRLRRNTNSSSSSSSEDDLFTESNNLAMFVVIPVLVVVYGGCACIYCCYKCRRYLKENKPFQEIADKIRGRETEENEDCNENLEDSTQDPPDEESRLETNSGCRNLHSNHSSPGPEGAVRYVDYDTDLRSAMSTPGMLYKRDNSVKSRIQKRSTSSAVVHNESDSEMRSDSGILEDSTLTHLSDSRSTRHKLSAEAPLVIEEIDHTAVESKGISSYAANNPSAPFYLTKHVSTSEIAIQTDDFDIQGNNAASVESKPPRNNVVAKYMDWRKSRKGTEKNQKNIKKDSKKDFSKSDTKNSFSSDSGISIISDKLATFGVNSEETLGNRNTTASFKFRNQPFKKTRTQESVTNMDLKEFIVGPWK